MSRKDKAAPRRGAVRRIYHKRSLTVEERTVELPNGNVLEDLPVVTHENGVIVVPMLTVDGEWYIMLIRQWRNAMGISTIEVPGGGPEKGESIGQAAIREVEEEAGLKVKKLISLGEVFPAPGWEIETQFHFLAECDGAVNGQKLDFSEHIERNLEPISRVREMLKNREIQDLKTRSILYDALEYLSKK